MTTTCCFTSFDPTSGFRVQVVGVDRNGTGVYHSSFESAMEYATQANRNGFTCFIHLD